MAVEDPDPPISPELALVSPELRAHAIRTSPAPPRSAPQSPGGGDADRRSVLSIARRLALYSIWQTFVGALFGLGLIVTLAVLVLVASLLIR